ncbi:AIPR family protein [Brunnivagina elsteri]|uniref:Abortive phage infection protein n=1 Tax=Brunnivagina elsteri CCALA 953 TaxID=987040 RepID=A0A2A2TEA4_9CYAN|nr:AIPR family protein [Calothrix elsteri]PAX52127.1 abortive phage infection protein [Calothrix elsteri CCALA 953]
MPKICAIKIDNHLKVSSNCIVATAHVADFPVDLPLEPNIREPNRKSGTYRQIFDSLTTEPEEFFARHSGIVLSANQVKVSKDKLELEILEASEGGSNGIINGGHTILAFKTAKNYDYNLAQARVKVTIHIGLEEKQAKDIALASNTSAPVDSRSKKNARGDYDFIKQYLAGLEMELGIKFRIAYYQNQSGTPVNAHCNVNHLFKLVNCLDRNRYNPENLRSKHPTSLSSTTKITGVEKERLIKLLPLLPQALWIEQKFYEVIQEYITNPKRKGGNDLASIDLRKNTLLPDSRYSFGFGAPADLVMPVVASFRAFLDKDYQWILPFEEFALELIRHLWDNYYRKYLISEKTAGNSIGARLSRNIDIWETMYISALTYSNRYLMNKHKLLNQENLVLSPNTKKQK